MNSIIESIDHKLNEMSKSWSWLEEEIKGASAGNLKRNFKKNKTTIPDLAKIFQVLGLEIIERKELNEIYKVAFCSCGCRGIKQLESIITGSTERKSIKEFAALKEQGCKIEYLHQSRISSIKMGCQKK